MNIKLISIEGRWGQPIYPPVPPLPKVADLFPERGPLRPRAAAIMNLLMKPTTERRYAR
jgi:hypothetical protein